MTAQELIEILQDLDPETEIYVQHTAGDYWRTKLASPIKNGDYGKVTYSSYHRQHKVSDEDEDYELESDGDTQEVFILDINQMY